MASNNEAHLTLHTDGQIKTIALPIEVAVDLLDSLPSDMRYTFAEGDPGGYDHIWMTPDEVMDSENVTEDEIDQARMAWRVGEDDEWMTDISS